MLASNWQGDVYGLREWVLGLQDLVVLPAQRQVVTNLSPLESVGEEEEEEEESEEEGGEGGSDDDDGDENVDADTDADAPPALAALADNEDPFQDLDEGTGPDGIEIYSGRAGTRTRVGLVRFTPDPGGQEVAIEGDDQWRAVLAEVNRILASLAVSGLTAITLTFAPMIFKSDGTLTVWRQPEPFVLSATRPTTTLAAPRFEGASGAEPVPTVVPEPNVVAAPTVTASAAVRQAPTSLRIMEDAAAPAEVDLTEWGAVHRLIKVALGAGDRVTDLLAQQLDRIQGSHERLAAQAERAAREILRLQGVIDGHTREVERLKLEAQLASTQAALAHQNEIARLRSEFEAERRQAERDRVEADLRRELALAQEAVETAKKRKAARTTTPSGEDDEDGWMGILREVVADKFMGGGGDGDGEVDYTKLLGQLRGAPPKKIAMSLKLLRPGQRKRALEELAKQDKGLAIQLITDLTTAVEAIQAEEE